MEVAEPPAALVEVRLLDGPNLYFPRPATKVTLDCAGLVDLPVSAARAPAGALGLRAARPGPAGPARLARSSGSASRSGC